MCAGVCLLMCVSVCFSLSMGVLWGHSLHWGASLSRNMEAGCTVERKLPATFRWACGSLRVCWVQGGVGESQGLAAPATCLGLSTPNLTRDQGTD